MWFNVKATDASFIDRAKRHFTYDFTVPGSPDAVFAAITDPAHFSGWFPDYRAARMITAEPHGVGSVREIELALISVRERYLVYDPGHCFAFTIVATNLPLMKRMMEDFRLSPVDATHTRVQWTIAYQPRRLLLPIHPIARPVFGRLFERGATSLKEYMARLAQEAA